MPWKESSQVSTRLEFVTLALQPGANIRELCRRFQISQTIGYKFLSRFKELGTDGLQDRSRRPLTSPRRSSAELESAVLALNTAHPCWGSRKLLPLLPERLRSVHVTTIDAILTRHERRVEGGPDPALAARTRFEHPAPNLLWQMDFKGHFALTSSGRCHPLNVIDDHSRFSLCLQACDNERGSTVKEALIATFRRYGLPQRITCDNGPPWGTGAAKTLSKLDVWLIRIGIGPSHSRPYHPQTQGKAERFHRTLKQELTGRVGFNSIEDCQTGFDTWRNQYNLVRPHQALGQKTPGTRYQASARLYPEQLPPVEYDEGFKVRKARGNGHVSYKKREIFVGEGLVGQEIGIRSTETDGVVDLYFCNRLIRNFDLREID